MRKLIISEFVTVDGVFEDPGGSEGTKNGGWSLKFNDEGTMKYKYDELFAADMMLLGRKTYEAFAKAWPNIKDAGDFGDRMNSMPKYVITSTLSELSWNSHAVKGDLAAEVTKLKQQDGANILVAGSGTLVRALLDLGLVDELNLMVYALVVGEGRKLLEGAKVKKLELKSTKQFKHAIVLEYTPGVKS